MNAPRDCILEAGDLRIRFFWRQDRYAHEVLLRRDGQWVVALASREGSAQDDWPASPPFQSLEASEHAGGQVLLVGMAGKSHWSASVAIDPAAGGAVFDVACRMRTAGGSLGSTYDAAERQPDVEVISAETIEQAGRLLRIDAPAAEDALPATVRWQYRLRPVD